MWEGQSDWTAPSIGQCPLIKIRSHCKPKWPNLENFPHIWDPNVSFWQSWQKMHLIRSLPIRFLECLFGNRFRSDLQWRQPLERLNTSKCEKWQGWQQSVERQQDFRPYQYLGKQHSDIVLNDWRKSSTGDKQWNILNTQLSVIPEEQLRSKTVFK